MKRLTVLSEAGPKHLVIAIHDKGGLDDQPLPESLTAYRFKGVISPKKVIELAERVACQPGPTREPGVVEPRVRAKAKPAKRNPG